ncbi:MAG: tetratricopeptide repeat protein [Alphaproteobacteria bacterium]|nr:tetratricopeptide repeat protein [Alphaproteobacteria bacterium]
MRRLWFAGALVLAVALFAVWLADQPGRLTLDVGDYRVEAPSSVGALALVLLVGGGAIGHALVRWLVNLPRRARSRAEWRRRQRGELLLSRGMVAVAAGDRATALRVARQVESLLPGSPLGVLLSVQAAQLVGDEQATRRYYAAMLQKPETEFLGLRGLAMQAHRLGQKSEALNLARRAYRLNPGTPWVLTALFELEAEAGNWREVERVTDRAIANRVVSESEGRRRKAVALYEQARTAQSHGDAANAERLAGSAHKLAPDFAPATLLAVALATARGRARVADQLLADAWSHAPHDNLAESFLNLHVADQPDRRLVRAERLTAANTENHESRLLLARVAVEANRLDRAEEVLAAIPRDTNDARVQRLRQELDSARGSARRSEANLPTLPEAWRCERCGHRHERWQALCGQCNAFDSLSWVHPVVAGAAAPQPVRPIQPDDWAAQAEAVAPVAMVIEETPPSLGR